MATYENNDSKVPATGVVGTVLGGTALALGAGLMNGGLGNGLFGSSSSSTQEKISDLQMQNAILNASKDVDTKLVSVYSELRTQDKNQDAVISAIDKRLSALETAAPLREQIVLGQVNSVAQSLATVNASLQGEIACIQKTLGGITATYVPAASVTPAPMPQYNSWTSPSTTTSTT